MCRCILYPTPVHNWQVHTPKLWEVQPTRYKKKHFFFTFICFSFFGSYITERKLYIINNLSMNDTQVANTCTEKSSITQVATTTQNEDMSTIHKRREQLLERQRYLFSEQRALDARMRVLQKDFLCLYADCTHPRDVRSRLAGPYSEKEWNCPDCGRCSS